MAVHPRAHRRSLAILLTSLAATAAFAQVRPRITEAVDRSKVVRLAGTAHPLAAIAAEIGRVPGQTRMERVVLQLKGSAEQQAALDQLVADQHDATSPRYHQWLTPAEFGAQFGPAPGDIAAVTDWLTGMGLTVDQVHAGGRAIEFSGNAALIEEAFRTELHRYRVNGQEKIANSTDISIPVAVSPVVDGVLSLTNLRAEPMYRKLPTPLPMTDLSGGTHGLSPYDFATIYDVQTLWNQGFDGTGQVIGIAGHTNIKASDVASFRTMFGLTGASVQVIVNGSDPGVISSGEETEADLDVEWAGAVAKGATVKFVVSASTNASDGLDLSNLYIVNNNLSGVITVSFGLCESLYGSGNSFYSGLWQQAAAQGISVFVASGDSGAAGCDVPYSASGNGANATRPASGGLGVNGLGSSAYNVAVGGTQFNEGSSSYWNPSNDPHLASAKSYIPEAVWNESQYTTAGATGNSLYAGGGGVSRVWQAPSWQAAPGVPASDPGSPTTHHRYVPDVSLTAAGHDGYLIVQEGQLEMVGGTSAATPSFAGIMAIVDQYTGARQGNPNTRLYPLGQLDAHCVPRHGQRDQRRALRGRLAELLGPHRLQDGGRDHRLQRGHGIRSRNRPRLRRRLRAGAELGERAGPALDHIDDAEPDYGLGFRADPDHQRQRLRRGSDRVVQL